MVGGLTDAHERGGRVLSDRLERTVVACDCGFADAMLRGEWHASVERAPHSRHLRYRLRCPDCAAETVVELSL
jgi:cytochrome c-type biogenesis protein CcmH/NrfF